MWAHLAFLSSVLFLPQTLLFAPSCYAADVLYTNATIATVSASRPIFSTTEVRQSTPVAAASPTLLPTTFTLISSGTAATSLLNISSTTSTTSIQPTQTIDPTTLHDIQLIASRRLSSIIGAITTSPNDITGWLATLGSNGKWPDSEINYTTGCDAQRANWPAQTHWSRILTMAAAWHGGLVGDDQFVKDPSLRADISSAMGYWFGRDFTNPGCLDSGGTPACPCTNPDNSLWNTNWFSNIILIPEFVSQACLLLNETLAATELSNCTHITGRAYGTFDHNINGVGTLTGANALDVAKTGIDQALLTKNVSLITDAYRRVGQELQIKNGIKIDGIRADGSFGQHGGMLYNGNYGKDYTNDLLDLEVESGGTMFAANSDSQNAFATLFDGDRWMIFRNSITGVLHWDFSALGRFISFPVIDAQATGGIKINLTEVLELGQQWSSATLTNFANSLSASTSNANAGKLEGNRMFYANDYMVHRGKTYITTVKMYSSRTQNTECTNSQNPEGFHLSDGTVYTYHVGNEYEDIAAAWDWNLIPGITVDYGATPLLCGTTQQTGIETFVGGVSDGKIGAAAMKYTNPLTKSLHFQKAWFFFSNDVQHVMISGITSTTNASVFSVLDQKLHTGSLIVDGSDRQSMAKATAETLWHANVGYVLSGLNNSATLSVQVGEKSGAWSAIGTSTQPPETVDLFSAYLEHDNVSAPISYTVYPGTTRSAFVTKSARTDLQTIQNDASISAVFDANNRIAMFVFWDEIGGSVTFTPGSNLAEITITVTGNLAVVYRVATGEVTVSDPSQSLTTAQVAFTLSSGKKPPKWGPGDVKTLIFQLPSGGLAGSSVTETID
ncbi:polysaccharide lyase family 8 protein [Pholiota conissans]|uniref:Polysaccharide lyase family 8 protein n=1 Tax=Pholiota conissans TaxID=109636 RepID=A0A9P5Z8K0_9AGAR|nr:polysaccharide lyase family 8 protein [Pholiota conissans]